MCVGGRSWLGEGNTPQAARHDAAARALVDLRPQRHDSPPIELADTSGNNNKKMLPDSINKERLA